MPTRWGAARVTVNMVVLIPASTKPVFSLILAEILEQTDLPEGVLNAMCMETFTPEVSIVAYDEFDEVLQQIKDSDFGLQAGTYTNDINKDLQAFNDVDVGRGCSMTW